MIEIPADFDQDRKVEAQVDDYGYVDTYRAFSYQVDCRGIQGRDVPQAFVVWVHITEASDTRDLAWIRTTHVILDETKSLPAYLLHNDGRIVECKVVRELGDSRKLFAAVS